MDSENRASKPQPFPWWGWVLVIVAAVIGLAGLFDFENQPNSPALSTTTSEDRNRTVTPETNSEPVTGSEPEFDWPEMEVLELSGTGDDVIVLPLPVESLAALEVNANAEGRYFSLMPIYGGGNPGSSLISTTQPVVGTVLIDGTRSAGVIGLEVLARGDWTLALKSIADVPKLETGTTYRGSDFKLLRVDETEGLTTLDIVGNAGARYFGVKARGLRSSSIVTAVDPYDGTVRVPDGTLLFEITAIGDWALTLN